MIRKGIKSSSTDLGNQICYLTNLFQKIVCVCVRAGVVKRRRTDGRLSAGCCGGGQEDA